MMMRMRVIDDDDDTDDGAAHSLLKALYCWRSHGGVLAVRPKANCSRKPASHATADLTL